MFLLFTIYLIVYCKKGVCPIEELAPSFSLFIENGRKCLFGMEGFVHSEWNTYICT